MSESEWRRASNIIRKEHEDPILVLFRIRNNRVDYSIMNRPEPTVSGISDAVLMSGLMDAGRSFKFKRSKSLADGDKTERSDGRGVVYKESIEVDWHERRIMSSKGKNLSLKVLSIVVQDLASRAARDAAKSKKPAHGPN